MTASPSKWADLAPRIASAVVLVAVGLGAIWAGGLVFGLLVAAAVGLIIWEVVRMLEPSRDGLARQLGLLAGAALLLAGFLPGILTILLLFGVVLIGLGALGGGGDRVRFMLYAPWILVAGYGLTAFRSDLGLIVILWLVALVVATDLLGYFAGRIIGGPKFWPRVSPKKTWSGTMAGWVGAGLVGLAFAGMLGTGVIWLSVLLSFASQMGDAAESALKRKTGVKDSSALIPGHGGVFDRFDALLGAGFCLYLAYMAGMFEA